MVDTVKQPMPTAITDSSEPKHFKKCRELTTKRTKLLENPSEQTDFVNLAPLLRHLRLRSVVVKK